MRREPLTISKNGRLDNFIEEIIRNWMNDPTGLDKILRNGGEEIIKSSKSSKSNKSVHVSST